MPFGICLRKLRKLKFWHKYVITYGDFKVFIESWTFQLNVVYMVNSFVVFH